MPIFSEGSYRLFHHVLKKLFDECLMHVRAADKKFSQFPRAGKFDRLTVAIDITAAGVNGTFILVFAVAAHGISRHCGKCRKQVFDLTNCSIDEVIALQRKHGPICGSIKVAQVAAVAVSLSAAACQSTQTTMGRIGPSLESGDQPINRVHLSGSPRPPEQLEKMKGIAPIEPTYFSVYSISRSPCTMRASIWGSNDSNHLSSARRLVLPMRSQTMTGALLLCRSRCGKSSSLVTMIASFCTA